MNIDNMLLNDTCDLTSLGDGAVFPADFEKTGLNLNELVVGTTGCGKTYSVVIPRMLHTFKSSLVVPLSKRQLIDKFSKMFRDRGYEVKEINFAKPELSDVGYDPMNYINSEEDIKSLAQSIVNPSEDIHSQDRYWDDCSVSMISSLIALIWLLAKEGVKKRACFADVIELFQKIEITDTRKSIVEYNINELFNEVEQKCPGNYACKLWRTVARLPEKTASTVLSTTGSILDKFCSQNVLNMFRNDNQISFEDLGERKMVLFVVTSPVDNGTHGIVNLMYSDMFRILFDTAERKADYKLSIPIHIICDDFAVGGRIRKFEDYISIFRAAGISVTVLLQSESQLISMYGPNASETIINNFDTRIFLGGMDVRTCKTIAEMTNMPVHKVLALPLGKEILFRRGSSPVILKRYQTLKDPLYIEYVMGSEKEKEQEALGS